MKPSVPSEHTRSVWMSIDMPTSTALNEHAVTEVCIIGSGIAGLTTAYRLLQEGKSVVVLESGTLGRGMTPIRGNEQTPVHRSKSHVTDSLAALGRSPFWGSIKRAERLRMGGVA